MATRKEFRETTEMNPFKWIKTHCSHCKLNCTKCPYPKNNRKEIV